MAGLLFNVGLSTTEVSLVGISREPHRQQEVRIDALYGFLLFINLFIWQNGSHQLLPYLVALSLHSLSEHFINELSSAVLKAAQ